MKRREFIKLLGAACRKRTKQRADRERHKR
jgi:hypothetical protein